MFCCFQACSSIAPGRFGALVAHDAIALELKGGEIWALLRASPACIVALVRVACKASDPQALLKPGRKGER